MISPCMFSEEFIDDLEHKIMYMHDSNAMEAERIQEILDAKYCPADLQTITHECDD